MIGQGGYMLDTKVYEGRLFDRFEPSLFAGVLVVSPSSFALR